MTIRTIYTVEPAFPATDQHPDALRIQIGALWVDYTGAEPTQADVDALLGPPTLAQLEAECDAVLSQSRLNRLLFEINFDQENRIRAREGLGAVTRAQYLTALKNTYKNLT